MLSNQIELLILVKGRPITEYPHQGQIFIEGRGGSEYEIELRNHSDRWLETVISVDGLSAIDGKPAGDKSQGYLIGPHGTSRIPGWLVDSSTAAKFVFSDKKRSYTAQSGGDTHNNGVIGIMAFAERVYVTQCWTPHNNPHTRQWNQQYFNSLWTQPIVGNVTTASNTTSASTTAVYNFSCATSNNCAAESIASASVGSNALGTAFGEAKEFATHTLAFQRGDLVATLLCYYDNRSGLKARGIRIGRCVQPHSPRAFPAMGRCQPPPGWQAVK